MHDEYILFFDQQEVRPSVQCALAAVKACYGFLHNISSDYLERDPTEYERRAWCLTYHPEHNREVRSNAHEGQFILETHGRVTIYLESNLDGTLAVAGAASIHVLGDRTKQSQEDAVDELKTQLRHTKQTMHQHVEAIKSLPRPENMPSWDEEVNPKQILEAAEDRIFAHNLHHALLEEQERSISAIEREAGLIKNSLLAMLSSIRPMRPTQGIINALAKALDIEPYHLWYDAVGAYNEAMGITNGKKLTLEVSDDILPVDLNAVEKLPPFIEEE